ncbi:hypothetical protein [Endozoicomonas elysicola]|uniref:Uncharacterized protein n=1 Tax=Endozoicomonas elysicola TaxID=305900 RepID=A0A081KBV0_9GAMM|nr:hypothetical protein [Endozoicomonas elysicola]KEI71626.1 hypothetical protein GV64_13540 [Endozoicomonas elysicola]
MTSPVMQQPGQSSYFQFGSASIDESRHQEGVDGVMAVKRQEKSVGTNPTFTGRVVGFLSSVCLNSPSIAADPSCQACSSNIFSSVCCCVVTTYLGGCAADITFEQVGCGYQKEESTGEMRLFVGVQPRGFHGMVEQAKANVNDLVDGAKTMFSRASGGNDGIADEQQLAEGNSQVGDQVETGGEELDTGTKKDN